MAEKVLQTSLGGRKDEKDVLAPNRGHLCASWDKKATPTGVGMPPVIGDLRGKLFTKPFEKDRHA